VNDQDRLEACFECNYRDVAAYCLRRLPREDAEEAVADVFAVAWRRIGDLPPPPEDRLWLFGTARRVVANQLRAARRRDRLLARLRSEPAAPLSHEVGGDVGRALAALSKADRELLLLSAWEGLSPAEIAEVIGRPAPVVSTRLYRARSRFAHVYEAPAPAPLKESPA
jgi:RNA polymerase sigma-70 factor (ECF subfamily)